MKRSTKAAVLNLADFEALAKKRLPKALFEHTAGGAEDEITLRDNVAAFQRLKIIPRVLRNITDRKTDTTVLGQPVSFPVLIAPMACLRRFHPQGELAVARAASKAGTISIISTGACYGFKKIAEAARGSAWLQLYAYRDKAVTQGLVEGAEAAGYKAICITVDVPVDGNRERDVRNRYYYPREMLYQNLKELGVKGVSREMNEAELLAFAGRKLRVALTWEYLEWLKTITKLPLVLKGILSPQDAARAVSSGINGIIVSNHGGRQLDGSPASIDALSEIAKAVDGHIEIFLDSGIRRGTDVLRAVALGARAVLLGRPCAWALTVDGERGVSRVLEILQKEFSTAMALAGCAGVAEITADLVHAR
ncbi:MAG: alpha-hydroxy acid oxidase [Candidatus Acidiferrales bacterium]